MKGFGSSLWAWMKAVMAAFAILQTIVRYCSDTLAPATFDGGGGGHNGFTVL